MPNEPDIEVVITTASARLAGNASQASQSVTAGVFTRDLRSYFTGWTLAEQMVLNRYQKRAQ